MNIKSKIVYVDLDGVVADIERSVDQYIAEHPWMVVRPAVYDLIDFEKIPPMENAVEFIQALQKQYEVYFCSTAPWDHVSSWTAKRIWVEKHFPSMYKRLILTHRKDLLIGDYLIDDRTKNGASNFVGEFLHYGSVRFPSFKEVSNHLGLK